MPLMSKARAMADPPQRLVSLTAPRHGLHNHEAAAAFPTSG
jgi:hypothetical protein